MSRTAGVLVYPKRDITNIVEASHYLKVPNWCKVGQRKCKVSRWVKPYRCLEGPFQSDALLVPENCLFDHIHNQTKCWEFARWNQTAARACQGRGLTLRSFAMLLPCGISLFSGVEFVCCPKHLKENMKLKKPMELAAPDQEDELSEVLSGGKLEGTEASNSDSDEDDDDDEPECKILIETALNQVEDALNRDEDADDEYEEDEEDDADDPGDELPLAGSSTPSPSSQSTSTTSNTPATAAPSASGQQQQQVPTPDPYFTHFDPRGEHQAFKEAQQRLEEMHREKVTKVSYPELAAKIRALMEDYLQALRSKDETPGSLLTMTRDAEAAILDKFRSDVQARQEEKDRQRLMERQRKEQRRAERLQLKAEQRRVEATVGQKLGSRFDPETMEDEHAVPSSAAAPSAEIPIMLHSDPAPRPAHAQAHDVSHGEPTYSVRREVYHRENKSIYFTLAFAGIALMAAGIVGIAVLRRRNARSPQNQGFVEVDQAATPEERHVANMQINGYENPTYKYFEAKE
ncbi:hypothetical protein B566_EDAN011996 [Ephemera danica]|nr:hypothetical protein B566_EDAN011996 [Ephemera danica]